MQIASRKPAEAAPARMGALSKLPIFVDLSGKRAVVAGGSAAAAWKAELLAAAGARVEVYAREFSSEMRELAARGARAGSVTLIDRPWSIGIFAGAALALCDAEHGHEAQAFYCCARGAGVPVNVIDKPRFCQFQFGSIVNRSPVVIGISTDGAAPILGQAIRRRIEMLLPQALSGWGQLAKKIRHRIGSALTPGAERRRFWETFSERAFRGDVPVDVEGTVSRLLTEARSQGRTVTGRVTLVGAGPGDAELLTIKAVRALQSADVILYDDLVSEEVLELARREAKRMMVGKRGGRESCRQDDINDLMVKLAKLGKHVVRLKCGDPMVFGRAGEEIGRLNSEGVEVAVVPGITSASAMAASLGRSLTHRACAQSLRFITGHGRDGDLPERLDWNGLADGATTLIVYMGGRTAAQLARRLIAAGAECDRPVVIVARVSHADERRHETSLEGLARDGVPVDMAKPVLIGIGATFASRPTGAAEVRLDEAV